jgi:hypothetical protein
MVDPQIRNCFGRSEANVYSHAPAAVFPEP